MTVNLIVFFRNSEAAMKGHTNCVRGGYSSPDRGGAQDKKGTTNHNANNENGGASGSSETAHDSKKGGSSSVSEAIPPVWPPKFVIALTNKEKEEDFMAIKGSKLPQRPKKRAKFIQRTLNVSPFHFFFPFLAITYNFYLSITLSRSTFLTLSL